MVCIDNVTRPFGSGTFANVVTSMTYADRILGVAKRRGAVSLCVACHGQQPYLRGRYGPRVVPIIIDPKVDAPKSGPVPRILTCQGMS